MHPNTNAFSDCSLACASARSGTGRDEGKQHQTSTAIGRGGDGGVSRRRGARRARALRFGSSRDRSALAGRRVAHLFRARSEAALGRPARARARCHLGRPKLPHRLGEARSSQPYPKRLCAVPLRALKRDELRITRRRGGEGQRERGDGGRWEGEGELDGEDGEDGGMAVFMARGVVSRAEDDCRRDRDSARARARVARRASGARGARTVDGQL